MEFDVLSSQLSEESVEKIHGKQYFENEHQQCLNKKLNNQILELQNISFVL